MVKAEIFGPDTYDSCANRVKKLTGILLIFHPGCGHCVQMRPEWEAMKERLPPGTRVVELDGSQMSDHKELLRNPIIRRTRGFPSIFKLHNGTMAEEYQGQRVAGEMHKFASIPANMPAKNKRNKSKRKSKVKKSMGKTKQRKRPRNRKLTRK